MPKICIWGDNHWSQYSSIVRKRGLKYSLRLENSIASLNWAESLASCKGCDMVICLGDFFDAPTLNAEEITALQGVHWNNLPKYFLVGNHEMGRSDLSFSSAHLFKYVPNSHVISQLTRMPINDFDDIFFIPYILEENRKPLDSMLSKKYGKRYIFSHNDIKGVQLGKVESKEGFTIEEIKRNCDWYFNGHIHNGSQVAKRVINVGNLTGQNFSEDATTYSHGCIIFNTDTDECDVYENPYAFNFYKIVYKKDKLSVLKNNAVVTISVNSEDVDICKEAINRTPQIIEYRLVVNSQTFPISVAETASLSIDHIEEFKKYVLRNIGDSDLVHSELNNIFS